MRSRYSNPNSPTSFRPLPDKAAREKELRTKRLRTGLFSVGAIALVTFSMVWNPPTGKTHSFTQASDYNAKKDSGCTNSGDGCHGTETAYTDFNAYHPNSECTTCHDYQGVGCIPCHSPDGHECQSCHDGTMEGAGDRTRITDPYPRGHYRETTHTATGTDMNAVVRTASDGEAGADCKQCHARDLYAAHQKVPEVEGSGYGDSVGCGECHNDTRSAGLEQVEKDWKGRRCEDCHAKRSSSPMHAADIAPSIEPTAGPGCERTGDGCHDVRDVHALHPDAPEDCSGSAVEGEPGCHDLSVESHVPSTTACGGGAEGACHAPYANDDLAHQHDSDVHSPGRRAATARFLGIACGDCHDMRDDGTSLIAEHSLATSSKAGGGPCTGCHNEATSTRVVAEDWAQREDADACDACHDSDSVDAMHGSDIAGLHVAQDSRGCANTGAGCHDTDVLSSTEGDSALHETCLRCHDRTGAGANGSYDPDADSCGSAGECHNRRGYYSARTLVHQGADGPTDGSDVLHTAASVQARVRVIDETSGVSYRCGDCHSMTLLAEHTRPGSSLAQAVPAVCTACHNRTDSTSAVVKDGWPSRDSQWACEACHGYEFLAHQDIEGAHAATALTATGAPDPQACSGEGCHAATDLRELHAETGCTTRGCHQATGDIAGLRRSSCGGNDAAAACHADIHPDLDGYGEKHLAGDKQADALLTDDATGTQLACLECHTMLITAEHERVNSTISVGPGTVCTRCHTAGDTVRDVVDGDWAQRDSDAACVACHPVTGETAPHTRTGGVHTATELVPNGSAAPGTCMRTGCHLTTDVRDLHTVAGCKAQGCHQATGDIRGANIMRCGGQDDGTSCHPGISPADHLQDHSADLTGTVEGVTYRAGENVGCFGCHKNDLIAEHSASLMAGSMEGGGAGPCRVCHEIADDSQRGDFASLVSVTGAITGSDRRCVACHRSGTSEDGDSGVASPHKALSTDDPLAPGSVWSDPLDDWRAALDAPTGGGHNALSAAVTGASRDKSFPGVSFEIGGLTYSWALPANTGSTAWLRTTELTPVNPTEGPWDARLFPGATTTETIQAAMVTCDDCHEMDDPEGPQGAAVKIAIDPDYAQTEYANPSTGTYQFDPYNVDIRNPDNPEGYKPIICVKCHLVYARARTGTTSVYVGGTSYHSTHASRHGETCIDCHVRIPHAWKRPRLLTRTVAGDGMPADTFPYVRTEHTGLTAISVTSVSLANPVGRNTCATGGCYSGYYAQQGEVRSETSTNHPVAGRDLPADQVYWP